jgi:hypothetical protein
MILKVNNTSIEKNFTITPNKILLGESELSIAPYFIFDGNDLKFSYLNFKNEKFRLEIYDKNELIFKTKIGNGFSIHSGSNLSKLETGNYKAVLTSFNKEYIYHYAK